MRDWLSYKRACIPRPGPHFAPRAPLPLLRRRVPRLRARRASCAGCAGADGGTGPAGARRCRQRRSLARDGTPARRADHDRGAARPQLPARPRGDRIPESPRLPAGVCQPVTLAGLRLLRRARPDDERVCAAGWIHRRAHGPGRHGAERVGTRRRASARDRPRHSTSHRSHDRAAEGVHRDGAGRASSGDPRIARGGFFQRRPHSGGDHGQPGGDGAIAAEFFARGRARGRSRRFPDADGSRIRRPRHGGILRANAVGNAHLRRHGAGLSAYAPDDGRAHFRHAEPHSQPAGEAAS